MELTDKEKEAADLLVRVMTKRKLEIYVDKDLGLKVIVTPEKTTDAKVKVTQIEQAEAAE